MIDPNDLNVFAVTQPLTDAGGGAFGTSVIRYEVQRYRDVRNLSEVLGYTLVCTQRVIVPNPQDYNVGPTASDAFIDYPAAIVNRIRVSANNGATILLNELFPRILNTAVTTSQSVESADTTSKSVQHSSGSNTAQTNTFGVAISGGFFGEAPTASLTFESQHSTETGSFNSDSRTRERGRQTGLAHGDSMSIKDWSSYGFADADEMSATWIWGQTYPWDVIQYNYTADGRNVSLPSFIVARLRDGNIVLPPSQLSQFGLDFTMKAGWLIQFPNGVLESEAVEIKHETTCFSASHRRVGEHIHATLQDSRVAPSSTYASPALDLSAYGLAMIENATADNGASIGFESDPFTYRSEGDGPFKIVSASNNLEVTGEGFDAHMTSSFAKPTSITVRFKILDSRNHYALMLMHWVAGSGNPVKLSVGVNGVPRDVVFWEAQEGLGGQNNVTALELRNLDFTSINYHDWLRLGVNEVKIDFSPSDEMRPAAYTLFALAIGQV